MKKEGRDHIHTTDKDCEEEPEELSSNERDWVNKGTSIGLNRDARGSIWYSLYVQFARGGKIFCPNVADLYLFLLRTNIYEHFLLCPIQNNKPWLKQLRGSWRSGANDFQPVRYTILKKTEKRRNKVIFNMKNVNVFHFFQYHQEKERYLTNPCDCTGWQMSWMVPETQGGFTNTFILILHIFNSSRRRKVENLICEKDLEGINQSIVKMW